MGGPHPGIRLATDVSGVLERNLANVEAKLRELCIAPDELGLDERWTRAAGAALALTARPAKRIRPLLLFVGHGLARGEPSVDPGVTRFAAALEVLHSFLLIHDDVADQATSRRGGPALHSQLGPGRLGEDLAIVVGDHLFARSLELMLSAGIPGAPEATRYMLGICRHTAVGQFLDLAAARTPLRDCALFHALKIAHLKTARYGFVGPLVAGAMLGGGEPWLLDALERAGRHAGLAFQLRDDLIGLFGEAEVTGKPADSDYMQGKVTFPVLAAHVRADAAGRERLETLWSWPDKTPATRREALDLVRRHGGDAATERAVHRSTHAAIRALAPVGCAGGLKEYLERFFTRLVSRCR